MNAPGGRATVTLEDAMQIMYLRYGRQLLDSQVRAAAPAADGRLPVQTTTALAGLPGIMCPNPLARERGGGKSRTPEPTHSRRPAVCLSAACALQQASTGAPPAAPAPRCRPDAPPLARSWRRCSAPRT
jgi:hypothetical protein